MSRVLFIDSIRTHNRTRNLNRLIWWFRLVNLLEFAVHCKSNPGDANRLRLRLRLRVRKCNVLPLLDSRASSSHRLCRWYLTCAWHGALPDCWRYTRKKITYIPAVTGRKGNVNKARARSSNGRSEGSVRQNPCT